MSGSNSNRRRPAVSTAPVLVQTEETQVAQTGEDALETDMMYEEVGEQETAQPVGVTIEAYDPEDDSQETLMSMARETAGNLRMSVSNLMLSTSTLRLSRNTIYAMGELSGSADKVLAMLDRDAAEL